MNKLLLAPIMASCLAVSACGYSVFDAVDDVRSATKSELDDANPITAQAAAVAAFDELGALGPDRVVFTTGDSFSIRADAPADLLSHLRYELKDGHLLVGRDSYRWDGKDKATIYVTGASLKALNGMGSGMIEVDAMRVPGVEINNAGSGTIRVADVQTSQLEVSMAGSGNITLAGKAASSDISIAGSGNVDASKLMSDNNDVSIAGSGDVTLRSDGRVEASIMGSGDVTVLGTAKCDLSSMGSGKLNCGG